MAQPDDTLKPPTTIKGEAGREWQRCCNELSKLGRLETVDRAILTIHCQTWAINRAAYDHVQSAGQTVEYSNGMVGPSPHYKNWKETTIVLRGTLADLGLTPESRKYKSTTKEDEPADLDI